MELIIYFLIGSLITLGFVLGINEFTLHSVLGKFLSKKDVIKYMNVDFKTEYYINPEYKILHPMPSFRRLGYNYISTHIGLFSKYHISETGVVLKWTPLHRKLESEFKFAIEKRNKQVSLYN